MQKLSDLIKNPSGLDSLENYAGEIPEDKWHVLLTRSRDSDILTQSNWRVALKKLDPSGKSVDVEIHRFGHWACGWWEALCVAKDSEAWETVMELHESLHDYPVLDEEHYSEMETEEANRVWRDLYTPYQRLEHLRSDYGGTENFHNFADLMQCVRGAFAPFTNDGYYGIIG
tara:strand:- start:8 stop:523 length:516 start_codon:yes stop_codon:yes gene_type:complete